MGAPPIPLTEEEKKAEWASIPKTEPPYGMIFLIAAICGLCCMACIYRCFCYKKHGNFATRAWGRGRKSNYEVIEDVPAGESAAVVQQ